MTEVEWDIADGYRLQGFAYHDGTIQEFRYGSVSADCAGRRDLLLDVANMQDELVRLRFSGVEILRVAELWEGSIINTIHAAKLSDAVAMRSPFQEFWRDLHEGEPGIQRLVSKFAGHLVAVVSGSYGCEFSLLCRGLDASRSPRPSSR